MIRPFALVVVLIVVYAALVQANRIRRGEGTAPDWRRAGRYGAALGLVAACEVLLPSTRLTGLDRPAPLEPVRHLDAVAWSAAPLTYDEAARRAPWLWTLGTLDRAGMEDRIAADIALAEAERKPLVALIERARLQITYRMGYADRVAELTTLISGLGAARGDLGTLFDGADGARRSVAQADLFVLDHLETVAGAARTAAERASREAAEAISTYLETRAAPGGDEADPVHQALMDAQREADTDYGSAYAPGLILSRRAGIVIARARDHDPRATLPRFAEALPVHEHRARWPMPPALAAGPAPAWSFARAARALRDAVTGRTRAPEEAVLEHRCVVAVVDAADGPAPRKMCEAARTVPVDYDLVSEACGEGAPCSESWIFPHLGVVFEAGAITVHAPRPAVGAAGTPLTLWHATWEGVEKPLSPSATFAWDGSGDVLDRLTLRHAARPEAGGVRILRDLRDGGAEAAPGFAPVTIPASALATSLETAAQFLSVGEDHEAPAASHWLIPSVRAAISGRRSALNMAARRLPRFGALPGIDPALAQATGLPSPCAFHDPRFGSTVDDAMAARMRAIALRATVNPCDAILAYAALVESLDHVSLGGSWFWLFSEPWP